MKKAMYVPPKFFHKIFPNTLWKSEVDKILLTFDDGPNPETTPLILEKLKEYSIKSLFFCVGENVEKYPDLMKRIIEEGHTIGNHTMSHKNISLLNLNANNSIFQCSQAIEKAVGSKPKYFRPPHGRLSLRISSLMKKNNLKNVMWSLLSYDYKNDINIVKFAIDNYLRENSIIVLHDSIKSKSIIAKSIELVVQRAEVCGYEVGEPSECLK